MAFHVTWGDPGINYLQVTNVREMDAALTTIANKTELPVTVFVDYELVEPATRLRVLVGHSTRSSVRRTRYGTPPQRYVAADPRLALFEVPLLCDVGGEYRRLTPRLTRLTPIAARSAVLDVVECTGLRPNTVPLWAEFTEPSHGDADGGGRWLSGHHERMGRCVAPFDTRTAGILDPSLDGPYTKGAPPDLVCGLVDDADAERLRRFAQAILSGHIAGHVMGSGVRLCRCGTVLEACRYRALAHSHLMPARPREGSSDDVLPQPAAATSSRALAAGRPVRCRRRPGSPV